MIAISIDTHKASLCLTFLGTRLKATGLPNFFKFSTQHYNNYNDMTSRHYVIWVRPCRSIVPWRLYAGADGRAVVWRDSESVNESAVGVAENRDQCAIVAPVDLPLEPSESLFVVMSDGARKDIEL